MTNFFSPLAIRSSVLSASGRLILGNPLAFASSLVQKMLGQGIDQSMQSAKTGHGLRRPLRTASLPGSPWVGTGYVTCPSSRLPIRKQRSAAGWCPVVASGQLTPLDAIAHPLDQPTQLHLVQAEH